MTDDRHDRPTESRRMHNVRNHISVIVGFCDLLLGEIPETDRKHSDILEIRRAADAAMSLLEGLREAP